MNDESFDRDAFDRDLLLTVVNSKGKSFVQLEQEVRAVGQVYAAEDSEDAEVYIRRKSGKYLLVSAADTSQPQVVVDRMYEDLVQLGFHDLHDTAAVALEYADYCREHGDSDKGIEALARLTEALEGHTDSTFNSQEVLRLAVGAMERLRKP